ncbi:MAG: type I restriction endonuclease subunit R, partial [Erysipelotrichaceae bacterium]|nr:type I restriction endonuclease subunit R [Erysipelotrichaceae bacterium]
KGLLVLIKRDNPDDVAHLGKEVSLKIYDRYEIAGGKSVYQIVQQPLFLKREGEERNNRGDLTLLINGMPVIHIELKRDKALMNAALEQIRRYKKQNVFTGLFSLVQVFVTMTPEETKYFANPGPDEDLNPNYFFQWADFNNEPITKWDKVIQALLVIPMAHQLIGFYTVADSADGALKVLRSYQYHAVNAITDAVTEKIWNLKTPRGGYIWHTTGSGKTMTSFKAAQLIASSGNADKVIFLTDRIELGTQSLDEYKGFAEENESVQATENTNILISKLKSPNPANTMIVTSIQKMSRIHDGQDGLKTSDIERINRKRLVFIVDEAHRSTFGVMLSTIKQTFPKAVFFGFTGTPIHEENQKKKSTTATVFGNELHRYSLADGIRDKNVLGFDPYKVMTFKDLELRKAVALKEAKAADLDEVYTDKKKEKVFNHFMDSSQVKMAGEKDEQGKWIKGIEDYVPKSQYQGEEHQKMVVRDIQEQWPFLSKNGQFSALLATSSISEAIAYYRLIRREMPELKVTSLFEPNIDNDTEILECSEPGKRKWEEKEEAIREILADYNQMFGKRYNSQDYPRFKKDLALRLAHKGQYKNVKKEGQLDLLIVVDQMLTGFDSKW